MISNYPRSRGTRARPQFTRQSSALAHGRVGADWMTPFGRDILSRALLLHEQLEKRIANSLGAAGRSQLIHLLRQLETV